MHTVRCTSDADCLRIAEQARRLAPHRIALRRTIAYLAIRLGPAWLAASTDLLEGYLPCNWQALPHHELVTHLNAHGITPEHCILL